MSNEPINEPIVPFWNRLREITLYPAHSSALITIGVLALCHLVGLLPLVGFILDLFVWAAMYKYAFECLRASADGRLLPPEGDMRVSDNLGWSQIGLQFFFIFLFVVLGAFGITLFGWIGIIVLLILLAIAWPASVMSLAMDQNLLHALNPATWLAIVARLGWPYIAVVALYLVFFFSETYAKAIVAAILPGFIAIVLISLITHYVIVATYHLMGYLIYQYHDEVGYQPAAQLAPIRHAGDDPDQALLDEAAQLVRDGNPDEACKLIGAQLHSRGGSEALHTQYSKLLALGDQIDERLRHGREWISILLAQDNDRRAVDVTRECLELDPAFQLAQPEQVARVAQKAADTGATQVALRLLSGFHKRYPRHADIPGNYLLAAKLLAERMGKIADARVVLDQLKAAYPNHPLAADIAAYRQFIDKLTPPAKNAAH